MNLDEFLAKAAARRSESWSLVVGWHLYHAIDKPPLDRLALVVEAIMAGKGRVQADYEWLESLYQSVTGLRNVSRQSSQGLEYYSVPWPFEETQENYNVHVSWWTSPSGISFWPDLLPNGSVSEEIEEYCSVCGHPSPCPSHPGSPTYAVVKAKPAAEKWRAFFMVTKALTAEGYRTLVSRLVAKAVPKLMTEMAKLAEAMDASGLIAFFGKEARYFED